MGVVGGLKRIRGCFRIRPVFRKKVHRRASEDSEDSGGPGRVPRNPAIPEIREIPEIWEDAGDSADSDPSGEASAGISAGACSEVSSGVSPVVPEKGAEEPKTVPSALPPFPAFFSASFSFKSNRLAPGWWQGRARAGLFGSRMKIRKITRQKAKQSNPMIRGNFQVVLPDFQGQTVLSHQLNKESAQTIPAHIFQNDLSVEFLFPVEDVDQHEAKNIP